MACAVISLVLATLGLNAQPNDQSEREEMYRRYLEFPKYVKGGTVQPHWMDRNRQNRQLSLKRDQR